MTTSQTAILSEPKDGEQISLAALAYMRARAKRRAYDLVINEFKKSGVTKAEIARRLFGPNKGADRVSRMLGGPGNWTLKTVADLLWAISASEPEYAVSYPLQKKRKNRTGFAKYLSDLDETGSESTSDSSVSIQPIRPDPSEGTAIKIIVSPKDGEVVAQSGKLTVKHLEAGL
jgi:hypothetical protein